jgi:dihydroneopterin aldolase
MTTQIEELYISTQKGEKKYSDKIHIVGLKANAIIGVYESEKTSKQPIEFDIALLTNISKSAHSDDINDTLDYAEVTKQVLAWIDHTKFQLIEKLAVHIAEKLLDTFPPVEEVCLCLKKFPDGLEAVAYTAVEIRRAR